MKDVEKWKVEFLGFENFSHTNTITLNYPASQQKYYDFSSEKIFLLRLLSKPSALESDYVLQDTVAKNVIGIGYVASK